eukprot:gene26904-4695_t
MQSNCCPLLVLMLVLAHFCCDVKATAKGYAPVAWFENHADITVDSSSHSLSLLLQPNTSNPAPATPVPQNASSAAVVGSYLQFNGDPKKAVVSAKAPANWKAEAPVGKVI